jgi:hypothetical protein
MNDFIIVVLTYCAIFFLALFVINFLMVNFFITYMRVKGARGRLILVMVYAVNRNYYRTGKVADGFLVYKDANKHEKRLKIPLNRNPFYRALNVTCINVDEERNIIIMPTGEVSGFDAEAINNLYLRTLYRPALNDPKQQILFIMVIIGTIASVLVLGILAFMVLKKLDLLIYNTEVMKTYFVGLNATIL